MQIDWLTIAAQIVNFLVLVWLLQRFLYKPITDAMRRREERIEERLTDAKAAREDAQEKARMLKHQQVALERDREVILEATRNEAAALRVELESEIHDDMEEKRETWKEHLAEERDAFVASLRLQAGQRVIEICERVLADYADSDVADRVVATFTERLDGLDAETRDKMSVAASQAKEPALVHTGAAIDSASKGHITRTIHEVLSTHIDVDYHQDRAMVLGIRLTIGDHTVEWSAARYLERLGDELSEIIGTASRISGRPPGRKTRKTA